MISNIKNVMEYYETYTERLKEEKKQLETENAKLKNTNDSLLAENNMFIKSLENIIRDDFVADYQSELHRVIRIAREALGVK